MLLLEGNDAKALTLEEWEYARGCLPKVKEHICSFTGGGVTQKFVNVARGFNRRYFLIPYFSHFLHTKGYQLRGVFTD